MRINQDNYKRPKITITDSLQNQEEVEKQLSNYEEVSVDELCHYLHKNIHVKYLIYKNNNYRFCLGGFLQIIKPEYVVLKNSNNITWSVQKNNNGKPTKFFRLMTHDERTLQLLEQQNDFINDQTEEINELKNKLAQYEQYFIEIQNSNNK